ncbi:MAG: hypothetical protein HC927_10215, partial [Deltaproteobacteria bacterium]|nr:hypothetical protein [Deltaproteobacteria bacterium]
RVGLADRIAIEDFATGEVLRMPTTQVVNPRYVDFSDAEHLIVLDWAGGAQLIRWRDGEVVDTIDVGNHVSTAKLVRAQGQGLMLIRTNLWANPLLLELAGDHFGARHLIGGGSNWIGLLAPREQDFEDWGAWTLDGSLVLRRYSLAELRAGVDSKAMLAPGEAITTGSLEQLTFDAKGRRFWVLTEGMRPRLHRTTGSQDESTLLPAGFVTMLDASPDGRWLLSCSSATTARS